MAKKVESKSCCGSFPTFAVILLVVAVIWILSDLGYIPVSVPWFPIIIAIIALGMIVNKNRK